MFSHMINTHFREADIEAACEFCQPPQPYFQNKLVTLYHGDARAILPELGCGATAMVTDPPYELNFMNKAFDRTGISFDPEFWELALMACLPGAHLLAFGGSRTFHRIACAIEDAGWEIRDTLMYVFGSGFPKSLNVSKALDKMAGAEREVLGEHPYANRGTAQSKQAVNLSGSPERELYITAPATDAAKLWEGYGSAIKPAYEPITLARKPIDGTIAGNCLEHGCGGLNIDGSRIDANGDKLGRGMISSRSEGWDRPWKHDDTAITETKARLTANVTKAESLGRWPANIIHDGSAEVLAGFPETTSGFKSGGQYGAGNFSTTDGVDGTACYNDTGSAARFFKACEQDAVGDLAEAPHRFKYCPKAGGDERDENAHPTVKPLSLMEYLCRLIKQPERNLVIDPFAGSGTTLLACELLGIPSVGIEMDEAYCEIIAKRFARPAAPFLF